jgi:hypothetical protein
MSAHHQWIAALLVLSGLGGCASAAPPTGSGLTPRVAVTGSRIAQPADPRGGVPQTASATQIVTQQDIQNTGRLDLAAALRAVVPALH